MCMAALAAALYLCSGGVTVLGAARVSAQQLAIGSNLASRCRSALARSSPTPTADARPRSNGVESDLT
jgi:hypothetical protein